MARSVSRKSSKKCPPGKVSRKSHMRAGKRVKAACVKKTTAKRSMKNLTMAAPRRSLLTKAGKDLTEKEFVDVVMCKTFIQHYLKGDDQVINPKTGKLIKVQDSKGYVTSRVKKAMKYCESKGIDPRDVAMESATTGRS